MRNILQSINALRKTVPLCDAMSSTLNSVRAAENVRKTVLWVLLPVSVRKPTALIRIFVSSVIPVGKTVHLMQFMLNIRRDNYGIYDNRRQKGRIYR